MTGRESIIDVPVATEAAIARKKRRRLFVGIEIGLWILTAIGAFLKFESWEGAVAWFAAFIAILSLFYLFFTTLVTDAGSRPERSIAIMGGVAIALRLMGGMFVIESWEGGREAMFLSVVLGVIVAGATLYHLAQAFRARTGKRFHWNMLVRLGVVFLLG